MPWSRELIAASAVPMVLSVLSHGESYGYAIAKRVAELTDGEMQWSDGMLYPVLHRLEKQGAIESEWRKAESGKKRKYYRLRTDGRRILREQQQNWTALTSTLQLLWEKPICST